MFLEVEIGLALAAADAAHVGLRRRRSDAFALQDVEAPPCAAFLEDPLGEVDEGVAVGVGGDVDDVAELLRHLFERHRRLVRRASRGLVV